MHALLRGSVRSAEKRYSKLRRCGRTRRSSRHLTSNIPTLDTARKPVEASHGLLALLMAEPSMRESAYP